MRPTTKTAGRIFALVYLVGWLAALWVLRYFWADVSGVVAIVACVILFAVAPDIQLLKRLLSGKEDEPRGPRKEPPE
jgi:hypothetical protein